MQDINCKVLTAVCTSTYQLHIT